VSTRGMDIHDANGQSVAEFAEKPLYRVTCGDIGTSPEAVEGYLDTIFYLGKIWDCGRLQLFGRQGGG
jgi:hypothetical protein